MRRILILIALVIGAGPLFATNGDREQKPSAPALPRGEAENYAQQLLFILRDVQNSYVRPVTLPELVRPALSGLYEAAHLPVPDSLAADIAAATGERELLALLVRQRSNFGNLDALQGSSALLASLRAMTAALDPYSTLITGEDLVRNNIDRIERGGGLEVVGDALTEQVVRIKSVALGGPAQRAGIRPGDQLTHIDEQPMDSPAAVVAMQFLLNTPSVQLSNKLDQSQEFKLTLRRVGRPQPWTVTVKTAIYKTETVLGVSRDLDNSWNYYLDRKQKIAQVRIAWLGCHTSEDLRDVLIQLENDGLRGLILDLRWCPGGVLRESVNVASLFVNEGVIATTRSREDGERTYPATPRGILIDCPLVVLVNGDTSGGAELIAAALQDYHRAIIVGQRTFGKASMQNQKALPIVNTGLKLTTGDFVRPSGKPLHRLPSSKPTDDWGVRPDPGHELPISPDLSAQLRDWWLLQSLRPGWSKELLPLDDPDNDPQRRAALRALQGQSKDES
jgi:carboxyl-terminal processing protease